MSAGTPCSINDSRRINSAHAGNVLTDGACEKLDILRQVTHIRTKTLPWPDGNVRTIQTHNPHGRFPEAYDEPCECRLACGAWPDNGQ